jgi:predicted dienelactone hydrolase
MRAAAAPLLLLALTGAGPVCDAVWHDAPRNRDVPVRIRLPDGSSRVPVVVFSPGMGGSIAAGGLWGTAWSEAGVAVVHVQHPGTGPEVYRDAKDAADRRARVAAAASAEQLAARVGDVGFVVDELAQRRREGACDLARLDLARLGIAGHSMGAWVAQAVAGQRFSGFAPYADRRFIAAIGISPSLLTRDDPAESLGAITIPFFVITGSEDGAPRPRKDEDAASLAARRARALAERTAPYEAMPPGSKYLLVIKGADHMALAGNTARAAAFPGVATGGVAATTAFWGAALLNRQDEKEQLQKGLKASLPPGDRFDMK